MDDRAPRADTLSARARLGKNSAWLLAARIGAQLLSLFTILLARKLGSAGFGEYAFFTTAVFIGNMISTCGTDMFFIREIAARDSLSRLPAALWIQLFLSGLLIVAVMAGAPALPNQSAASVLALQVYSLALIPLAFYTVFGTALRGRQRMGSYALLSFAGALLQAIVVLFFVAGDHSVVGLAVLLLLAQVVATLFAAWLCAARIAGFWRGWHFSRQDFRDVFVASAPLGLLGALGVVYQRLGLVLLSTLGGAALAGWYSAGFRIVEASKTVHMATLTAVYPAMSEAQLEPSGQVAGAIRLLWKLLLAGSAALALALSLLAGPLASLLYGAAFAPAAAVLAVLAWTLVPYTANTFLTLALVAAHRENAVARALAAGLLGLALMCLAWVPAWGAVGAAWAALLAECLQAFVLLAQRPALSPSTVQGKPHELSELS